MSSYYVSSYSGASGASDSSAIVDPYISTAAAPSAAAAAAAASATTGHFDSTAYVDPSLRVYQHHGAPGHHHHGHQHHHHQMANYNGTVQAYPRYSPVYQQPQQQRSMESIKSMDPAYYQQQQVRLHLNNQLKFI
jgi:hypothetical protein